MDSQCYRFAPSTTLAANKTTDWITFELAAVAYKTRQSGIPEYLHCDIRDYQPCRTLRSTSALLLQQPPATVALASRAFTRVATPISLELS